MILEIYDLECLSNLFTYTGYVPNEDTYYQFCICSWRNDFNQLYKHLTRDLITQVGFNNESYDYPLEHYLLSNYDLYKDCSGQTIAEALYRKSQEIILSDFHSIPYKQRKITQIDLFRIWHFNNKARATSLKQLEVAMRMPNVQEMPIHHAAYCRKGDELTVLEYNKNDVYATYLFFNTTIGKTDYPLYKGKNKLELRNNIQKKFHVNCINLADVPMGERLMLHLYSRATKSNPYDIKKLRTYRQEIRLKDCIPKWCDIKSSEFNKFLEVLIGTVITNGNTDFEYSVNFHGYKIDFGLGGSHGCCKAGIYESNDEFGIFDFDVSSLYPSLAKSLRLYPEHLGVEFINLYSKFVDDRLKEKTKPKEQRDDVLVEGYKLTLNGVYGKSNEDKSFLYDPLT